MKYFVKNNSEDTYIERKPGVGEFILPRRGMLEIHDKYDEVETPLKTKVPYLRYPAKQIAESIVNDFKRPGILEVVEEEEK